MPATGKIQGFSLIELLVTISIIAIITIIGFTMFSQAQMRGRDAKRKLDLRSIALALDIYKKQNGRYPCAEWNVSNGGQYWIADNLGSTQAITGTPCAINPNTKLDEKYISSLPVDPLNKGTGIPYFDLNGYYYVYRTLHCGRYGDYYVLLANLENKNDPERISANNIKYCDGTDFYPSNAGTVQNPSLFVITSE